jgi:thiol-disulfide isomerase/thioredoxin
MKLLRCWVFLCAAAAAALAAAGVSAQTESTFAGRTLQGNVFDLAERRGRVVLLVLWRTDCAVCLSKMPELRANAAGWRAKPFDLVLLNLDPAKADAQAYEQARQQTGATYAPLWSLWQGDTRLPAEWHKTARLPVLLLFDTDGKLVKRHEGRVPAEAWDEVAELLP